MAKIVTLILAAAIAAYSQSTPPQTLQIQAPGPRPVSLAGGGVVGNTGGQTLYYWVNVRYASGVVIMPNPIAVFNTVGSANLSVSNYVNVSWAAVPGATGYDVIRSTTPLYPASLSCADCAVALNTASLTASDQSPTGSAYPPGGLNQASGVTGTLYIDNTTNSVPYVNMQLLYRSTENLIVGLISGAIANDDCLKYSNGRIVSAGAACGSGGGGTASYLVVNLDGTLTDERKFTGNNGVSCVDGGAGGNYTCSADSAVVTFRNNLQAGTTLLCSGSASTTATCAMAPTLTAYTTGMVVQFLPGATNTTTYTLNIDTVGAKSILTCTAGALSAGDIVSGQQVPITYDGTQFRLPCKSAPVTTGPWLPFGGFNANISSSSALGAANRVRYAAVSVETTRTVSRVGFYTGNAHSGNIAFAIYDSNCNLLAQSDTQASAAPNTAYFVNISATLTPGKYFIAGTGDNTAMAVYWGQLYPAYTSAVANASPNNTNTTYQQFYGSNSSTNPTATTLAFPATCGTRTALVDSVSNSYFLYFE